MINKNEYWNNEEFEDRVARGLIAMYETKISSPKDIAKHTILTPKILESLRKSGCYFPPKDRVMMAKLDDNENMEIIQEVDLKNDPLPNNAVVCIPIYKVDSIFPDDMRHGSYLEISYAQRLNELPGSFKPIKIGIPYRQTLIWARNDCLEGVSRYFTVTRNGEIVSAYYLRTYFDSSTGRAMSEKIYSHDIKTTGSKDYVTASGAAALFFHSDKRYLWNVTAKEHIAKATFGCYPEEIKSLFFARELPMTETGRKRPILHWVAAHQRRIKSGYEIDIEKYLRGTNEFVYNGTKFEITRPIKEPK